MKKEKIYVNAKKVKAHSKVILNECSEIAVLFKKIKTECLDKLNKEWKSDDHIPYFNEFVKGLNEITQFQKSIEKYAYFLETAANEYESMQEKATSESAKIRM